MVTNLWRVLGLGLMIAQAPGMLESQTASISGRVRESELSDPIRGVLLVLLNADGEPVQSRLSNSFGRYVFTGVTPGEYSLRADMIGYATTRSGLFMLTPDEVHILDLTVEIVAIHLEGFAITGERRCGLDPNEGIVLAQLWSEVREALERASYTGGVPFVYETQSFTRTLTRDASRVMKEEFESQLIFSGVPYVSIDSEIFRERGYAFHNDTTGLVEYYGPDTEVLLSDAFAETHCFELRAGDDEAAGLVGIGFTPLDGRNLPEIEGVLWVDPESFKLSHLEFRFQNVLRGSGQKHIGGRIDFAELPSGLWIIEEWSLRVPLVSHRSNREWGVRRRRFRPNELLAIQEVGGVVDLVRDADGQPVFDAHAGLVRGIVVDADTDAPVVGALVTLGDTGRVARTNESGAFSFGDIPEGVYRFTFQNADGTFLGEVEERPRPGVQTFIRFLVQQ